MCDALACPCFRQPSTSRVGLRAAGEAAARDAGRASVAGRPRLAPSGGALLDCRPWLPVSAAVASLRC
eukprot:8719555-Alexandrium_andersonii.AAC.1